MKLEAFLTDQGVGFEKHLHAAIYTSQGLAQAEHVSGYMVAKPVIVKHGGGFTMCVLPAPKHLDLDRVCDVLQESDVRLASEEELAELFDDCELGAEPPVGPMFDMPTVMDPLLQKDEYLLMQAGSHAESVKVKRADWEKICRPVVAAIAAH